jgi:hypothetical protein
MFKTNQKMTVLMCVMASFLGGAAANLFLVQGSRNANAQDAAAKEFKVITANRFMLVDSQGRPRAALTASKKTNNPMLMFLDEEGTLRMTIALGKTGDPTIAMLSKDKKNSIAMNVKKDGQGAFMMVGQDGSTAGSWAIYKDEIAKKWKTRLESGAVDAKDE